MSMLEPRPTSSSERAASMWLPSRRSEDGVRTYRGRSLAALLPRIRAELGPEAVILREREGLVGGVGGFFATRFVEVQARAGGGSIDLYDEDEAALPPAPDAAPAVPAPMTSAPAVPPAPVPPAPVTTAPALGPDETPGSHSPEFARRLESAVAAWTEQAVAAETVPEPRPSIEAAQAAALDEIVAELDPAPEATPSADELAERLIQPAERRDAGVGSRTTDDAVGAAATGGTPVGPAATGGTPGAPVAPSGGLRERLPEPNELPAPVTGTAVRRSGRLVRRGLPAQPAAPKPVDTAAASRALGQLTHLGASADFARELIAAAAAHGPAVVGGLHAAVVAELSRRLAPAPSLPVGGAAIGFVGAGGSGKTLAAAALAASYRYGSSLPVTVVSLCDAHGSGRLADLLGPDEVPVGRHDVSLGLTGAAEQVRRARAAGGLVIVDTPGVAPADLTGVARLAHGLAELDLDAVYVVLPATLGAVAAQRALTGLAPLGAAGMVISHADESDQLGVLVELAVGAQLPVAYLTAGADHRRALVGTDPTSLARLLLP